MIDDRFAPPSAEVADIRPATTGTPPFFAVSPIKLAVLSVCTMGVYELYWFYRNWKLIRSREETSILPFWRAFFAVLFCYPCLRRIREAGLERGVSPALPAGWLASAWIVTTVAVKLPDPYWLVTLLAVVFLVPVQSHVDRLNSLAVPGHDRNARFSAWNWVAVVLGGLLVVLAIIGTFLPEPAP